MHYEIVLLAGWVFKPWSCSVQYFLVCWGYVHCEGTHSTSSHIHIYNGCRQTKTTRQASTLSKTAKKTEGQWHPSNLCSTSCSHSCTPKPHSQWLVDSFCIHWCTPNNITMWYCESLQEPSVRGFNFHAVNFIMQIEGTFDTRSMHQWQSKHFVIKATAYCNKTRCR